MGRVGVGVERDHVVVAEIGLSLIMATWRDQTKCPRHNLYLNSHHDNNESVQAR